MKPTLAFFAIIYSANAQTCSDMEQVYNSVGCCSNNNLHTKPSLTCPISHSDTIIEYKGIQFATAERFKRPVLRNDVDLTKCHFPNSELECVQTSGAGNEECLFMDIITRSDFTNAPVMIYWHGGGHIAHRNQKLFPNETPLTADHDVIVIHAQYRLGSFQAIATQSLADEDVDGSTGAYALWDHLAALQWINAHISKFGGDPTRVTMAGFSAGALSAIMMTSSHLLCEPGKPQLVHRVIAQGSWNMGPRTVHNPTTQDRETAIANAVGITNSTLLLDHLRSLSKEKLATYATLFADASADVRPNADGVIVPHSYDRFSNPCGLDVLSEDSVEAPSLFGSGKYDQIASLTVADWKARTSENITSSIFENTYENNNKLFGDDICMLSVFHAARKTMSTKGRSYALLHSWVTDDNLGHAQSPTLMKKAHILLKNGGAKLDGELAALSDRMRNLYAQFITNGMIDGYSGMTDSINSPVLEVKMNANHISTLSQISQTAHDTYERMYTIAPSVMNP